MSSTRKNPSRKSSKAHSTPPGSLTSSQKPSLDSPSSFSANTTLSTATITALPFTSTTSSPGNLRQRRDHVANPSTSPTLSSGLEPILSTTILPVPATMASNIGGNSMTSNVPGPHQTQPMYHPGPYAIPPPGMYSHPSALQAAQHRQVKTEDVKHEGALYPDNMGPGVRMARNPGMHTVGGTDDDEEPVPLFKQLIDPNAHNPQMSRPAYAQNHYHHDSRINPTGGGGGAGNPVNDPTPRTNYGYPYNANPYGYSNYPDSTPTNPQQRPALYEVAQSVIKHQVPDGYISPPEMRPVPVPSYAQEQLLPPSDIMSSVVSFDPNELPAHRRNPQAPNFIVQNAEQGYALMRYLEQNEQRRVKPEQGGEDAARDMANPDPRGPGYPGYGNEHEGNWSAQTSPVRTSNPQGWAPHQTEGGPAPGARPYYPAGQPPPQGWVHRAPNTVPSERGTSPFFQPSHPSHPTHSAHPSRDNIQWTQAEGGRPSHLPMQPHPDIDGRADDAMRWQNPSMTHRSGSWENPGEAPTPHGNPSGYPTNDVHATGAAAGHGNVPVRQLNTRVGRVSVGGGTGSSHPSPTTWSPSTTSQPHTSHPPWVSSQHPEHPHTGGNLPLDGRIQTPGGTGAAHGSNTAYSTTVQTSGSNPGIQPSPNNSAYGQATYPSFGSQGGPPEPFPRGDAVYPPQPRPPPPGMNPYPSSNVAHQQASGVMGGGGGSGPSPAPGAYEAQPNPSGNPYPQIPNQPPRPGTTAQQQQQHLHQQPPPNATSNMYPAIYPPAPHPNRNDSIDGPYSSTTFRGQAGPPPSLPNYPLGVHPPPPNVTTQQPRQLHQNPTGSAGPMQNMNAYPHMTGPGGPDMYGSGMHPYAAAPPHPQ